MSDSLNQLISVIDNLLAYSKDSHAAAVKEVELKLSNNELLELFAAKFAVIKNPPFITSELVDQKLAHLEETLSRSISKAIADVQDGMNTKIDNLSRSIKEEISKISAEFSKNETILQGMQQKHEATLQSFKSDFTSVVSSTESTLKGLISNIAQTSQDSIESLSKTTKQLLDENKQSTESKLTSEILKNVESLKSDGNMRFKMVADLLSDAKTPIFGGQIFKEPSQQEVINQLIGNLSTNINTACSQNTSAPPHEGDYIDEETNPVANIILTKLATFKAKSDAQNDEAINKIKTNCVSATAKSSLLNMNIGKYYQGIDDKRWKDIINAAFREAESK